MAGFCSCCWPVESLEDAQGPPLPAKVVPKKWLPCNTHLAFGQATRQVGGKACQFGLSLEDPRHPCQCFGGKWRKFYGSQVLLEPGFLEGKTGR